MIPAIPVWAKKIDVKRTGETLIVTGTGRLISPMHSGQLTNAEDLLLQYTKPTWGIQRRHDAPYLKFANANDDLCLIDFVHRFGPVCAEKSEIIAVDEVSATCIVVAHQQMESLRRQQEVFSAAVTTLAEVQRKGKANVDNIVSSLKKMAKAEIKAGEEIDWGSTSLVTQLAESRPVLAAAIIANVLIESKPRNARRYALSLGHNALCKLLNKHPSTLQHFAGNVAELPVFALSGVSSVLHYMLRRDYLLGSGLATCTRVDCGAFFRIERLGQMFCTPECSRLQRQRDYWKHKGSERRKKRKETIKGRAAKTKRG